MRGGGFKIQQGERERSVVGSTEGNMDVRNTRWRSALRNGAEAKNCPHKVRRKKGKCKEQKRMNGNNPRGIEQKSQEESRNLDPAADQKVWSHWTDTILETSREHEKNQKIDEELQEKIRRNKNKQSRSVKKVVMTLQWIPSLSLLFFYICLEPRSYRRPTSSLLVFQVNLRR